MMHWCTNCNLQLQECITHKPQSEKVNHMIQLRASIQNILGSEATIDTINDGPE